MMSSLFQMKRTVLIVFSLLLLLSTSLWAQFPEGFESGAIPATWTVHNVDGNANQFIAYNAGANAYEGSWVARVSWNAAGNNDWLVTPALSITSLAKTVKFWARSTSDYYSESFNIKLSTTGTAVDNFTISLGSFQDIPNAWTEYIVDLEDYIGDTVHLAVQSVSVDELAFHVDGFDWVLGDDLSGYAISGSTAPTVNTVNDYVVTVKNNGGNSQSTYTVKFLVDEVEVATQAGTTLAPGATADFTFAWTPTAVQNYELQGQVILANDGNTNNDYTDILTAVVQPAGTAAVTVGDINTTTSSNSYPINFYWKNSLSQTIYMSEELNIGGNITLYKYHANLAGDITGTKPLKVWMANTAETTFESNTAWLPISEFTLVFDGTIDFTGLTGSTEISIPLEIPFAYGGGNLCVMVQRPLDSVYYLSSNTWKNTATSEYPNRTIYYYSDSVAADPTTPPTASARVANVPNTTFMLVTGGLADLTGTVTCNGNPVAGALVEVDNTTRSALTNADGEYTIPYLNPGTVNLTTSKLGYIDTHTTGVVLVADETTTQNIVIEQLPYVEVSGIVKKASGGAVVAGAVIKLTGYENYETVSAADGSFTIDEVYTNHDYTLSVLKGGFVVYTDEVEVGTNDIDLGDIELVTNPALVELLVGDPNTTTGAYQYPMNYYYKASLVQSIYMEDEINVDYCLGDQAAITSIRYYTSLDGAIPADKPIKIWAANTEQSAFAGTAGWLPFDDFTLVFDGTVDLSSASTLELDIDFDVPFAYDGGNLVLMILKPLDSAWYTTANTFKYTATPNYPNRTIYYQSDSVDPNPAAPLTGTLVGNVTNTRFSFSTAGFASLSGVVSSSSGPVEGVKVAVDGTTRYTMTNAQGEYNMNLLIPGTVNLTATKFGYIDAHEAGVVLTADEATVKNITIAQLPVVTVSGQVNASDTSAGLAGATVTLTGYEDYAAESNASGVFTIPGVYANNTYTLKITAPGYQAHTEELAVAGANVTVPAITLNELANPPSGVVATPSADQVDITWNAPGDGVDVWFSHTSLDTFSDAIGTGGAAQFEVAHRYTPAQLETYGVAGATLEKVQFMPHEPTATYGIKIYTGTAGSGPGPLAYTQAVSSVVVDDWNEVELAESVQIPSDTDLWIAIDINTPTGYPAGCDDGPALIGYGDMMYFSGAWATLDDLAGIDANWMIKGMAAGATGPRTFTINTGVQTPSEDAFLAKRSSKPAPFAKASENGHVPTRTSTPTENKPVFTQTTNTRAITGYNVWRTPVASTGNEDAWTQLATALTVTEYTDETWAQVETGEFKYVVKAIYTGGVASNPAFSNTVFKNMTAAVNISLATADGASPAGAVVTLTNTDGNPDHVYTQTANSANVIFPQVWHGIYSIKVVKAGYQTVIQDNVIIAGDSYTHPTITLPVSAIFLSEGFEGAFPPAGWTILDSDGDGHNWMQWDYTPHIGTYSAASGSYDNSVGQLYPDNWLITPQLNLNPGTTNTMTFWVAPQDASYPQDHYSVMVSTTNNQPASFTEIYSETITGSDWEERTVNLPYAGQDIYIAFRHHDCTDWYIMKIDDIEIASTESADELTPIVKPTALHGNYPNPFNPTTTISYDLANDGNVAIDIYNIKGQKVKTLVNDRQNAGAHTVVWNGQDDNGKHVGSGIYFFNMKAGKYTSTRKMILMK